MKAPAADTVDIGGEYFVLEAHPHRDFMAISPPAGRRMIFVNRLVNMEGGSVPSRLRLKLQQVIYHDSLWTAPYDGSALQEPSVIERASRNGPL